MFDNIINKYVCNLSRGLFLDDYNVLIEWDMSPSQLKDKISVFDSFFVLNYTSKLVSYNIESKLFDSHNTFAISFNYMREKMKSVNIWQKETAMPLDQNFEEMQELETRLKNFEAVFNDFLGKLAGASKRIEALNSNKERADFAVEKLMELDSMLGDIDAKIESVTKARKWLADTESRLVQLNDSAVKNLTTLKEVTELSNLSNGKGKVDQNVLILRLAQQGWSAADIAKKLNVGLGEVQLIIEMNLNK